MSHIISIIGGSGFVGTHLATELTRRGHTVRILTRKLNANHPLSKTNNIHLHHVDTFDKESLSSIFEGCDAVINLVGILNETGGPENTFKQAHIDLTKTVIHACLASNVERLLHMSALHANAEAGPSQYLFSKGIAQNLVMQANQEGLATTSFCPSIIFGPGDSFFNRFASLLKFAPIFPLACPSSRFAPVYVGDVADAFITALDDDETIGKSYPLCGPGIYTLKELVEYTAQTAGLKRLVIGLNDPLSRLQARMLGMLPGKPMSYDNYLSLTVDSVCDGDWPSVFTAPHRLEDIVPGYLGK